MSGAGQTDTLTLASVSRSCDAKEQATQDPFHNEWPSYLGQHPVLMVMVIQAESRGSEKSDDLSRVQELKTSRGI